MNEQRFVLSDILWQQLESHLPGKVSDAGVPSKDNPLFLEAGAHRVAVARPAASLVAGTASSGGFASGPGRAYPRVFSKR
jgi:hypothetical protein